MDRPDLLDDPRFAKLADRADARRHDQRHRRRLDGDARRARRSRNAASRTTFPSRPRTPSADIFADPHFDARHDLVTVDDPVIGPIRQQAPYPRRVGETPVAPTGAPRLGEHTDEVLADVLHLSTADIDALRAKGVV